MTAASADRGFHARELAIELGAAAASLGEVRWDADADAAERRWRIEEALAHIEHAMADHADPPVPNDAARRERTDVALAGALAAGRGAAERARAALAAIGTGVAGVDLVPARDALRDALAAAVSAHHLVDPLAAMDEDAEAEAATPLTVGSRSDARELTVCPTCRSALGPDDRTFTGTFCEVCRTRWVASG